MAKALIEREMAQLLVDARAASADVSALARALGVHRATLYRRFEGTAKSLNAEISSITFDGRPPSSG